MVQELRTGFFKFQVNSSFGWVEDRDRVSKMSMGGGTTIDMGIYCVNLACMMFDGERPEKILAAGLLNEEGCDAAVSCTLQYKVRIFLGVSCSRVIWDML